MQGSLKRSQVNTPPAPSTRMRQAFGPLPLWALGLALALLLGVVAPLVYSSAALQAQSQSGLTYTVRPGDSWPRVAARLGIDENVLRAANPEKDRENDWLIEGEQLVIPVTAGVAQRTHEVQIGESWNSIATRYDISIGLLQAANPRSVRSGMLLYRGERLVIPPPPSTSLPDPVDDPAADEEPAEDPDEALDEEADEELAAEAAQEDAVSPALATTGTPTATTSVTTTVAPTATSTATSTATATVTATATPAASPAATPAATPAVPEEADATESDTAEDTAATDLVEDDTEPFELPACPARFLDYPQAMTQAINAVPADGPANLRAFLDACEALDNGGFVAQDLTGNEVDDVVVVYRNPSLESIFVESDLAIFNGREDGYTLAYRARAAGDVYVLAVEDINLDEQMDVAWVDTTCGASTCFDTVNIRSWTGSSWADWTEGTITMAYAGISLASIDDLELDDLFAAREVDVAEDDVAEDEEVEEHAPAGQAIIMVGGIYGSVGAGPQRSREEIWASVNGAPYALISREFMTSECLYHVVVDANAAFITGWDDDFAAAQALYNQAVRDNELLKCWVRPDEEDELRSFSMFRLALIAGYLEDADTAAERAQAVIEAYPDEPYEAVAAIWLREYRSSGDAAAACQVVTQFAELTPETWEILADYGYTNPGFSAEDVCPVLLAPDPDDIPDAGPVSPDGENGSGQSGNGQGNDEVQQADENAGAPEGALASFPDCPADLTGYAAAVAGVLTFAEGDEDLIEAWLIRCRAMSEDRGAFILTDITGDGATDAVVFPVLVTDLGFGPGGAQGTALIYHAGTDGSYTLAAQPEIYGQPEPLAIADLNGNGRIEVAWTVTGCSIFCVTEVQMWSWDGTEYVPAILPGATMANAEVSFEPVIPLIRGDGGNGANGEDGAQRLVLYGGVSGTVDGGLETPHWEEWQSFEGEPYARIRWEYDRATEGSECLGLRLVEADVALQAADRIGYAPALELYTNALADLAAGELSACSIMGMASETEISLLQGLANFRLLQVYALSGEEALAAELLADFESNGPPSDYVDVAAAWWEALGESAGDAPTASALASAAVLACAQVLPLIDDNPELWQVTDQYGYNHPVLAAEQICYAPLPD